MDKSQKNTKVLQRTMNPTQEQEAAWAVHKAECYDRWRAEKLSAAVKYVQALPTSGHSAAMQKIRNKFGKRFAADVSREVLK